MVNMVGDLVTPGLVGDSLRLNGGDSGEGVGENPEGGAVVSVGDRLYVGKLIGPREKNRPPIEGELTGLKKGLKLITDFFSGYRK